MGLWSRLSQLWPWAEIMPSKCHPCLCLGCAGIFVFLHTEHLYPKKWIIFRLTLIINAFSYLLAICPTFSAFCLQQLYGDFRIMPHFTFSHLPLTTFFCSKMATLDYLPITREGSDPPSESYHVDITRCANMFPL